MSTHNAESPFRGVRRLALGRRWRLAIDRFLHKEFPWIIERLPLGCKSMEDVLNWARSHRDYEVYSFDVFDTLLRRKMDPPEEIKSLVAGYVSGLLRQRGLQASAEGILAQRNRAERDLQQRSVLAGRDAVCCLDNIVEEMLKGLGAEGVLDSQQVVDYELALEVNANEPMPGVREVLTHLKSGGKRVIGVSDMYLSGHQIRRILAHHGLLEYVDELYVSCDVGWRKDTKKLFEHVIEREGRYLVHIGDSYSVDVVPPRDLGLTALWFHSRKEQRRKGRIRRLKALRQKMHYVSALGGGVDDRANGFFRIGHEVLGPALTVFVHNVAQAAKRAGVETLFFVARDGYGMKKIYEELRRNGLLDASYPPAKYLCLSRAPARLASLRSLSRSDLVEVQAYMVRLAGKEASVADVLRSYEMEPQAFTAVAERHGVDLDHPAVDIEDGRMQSLLQDEEFQDMVAVRSRGARELLREYLAGIGFMGGRKVALVDAVSEGKTQALLARALGDDQGYPSVYGYYFSLLQLTAHGADSNQGGSQSRGICYDQHIMSQDDRNVSGLLGLLIELFTHPNHGVTVGYKRKEGRVVPVFRTTAQESQYAATSAGLQGMLSYAATYARCYGLHGFEAEDLLPCVRKDLSRWKWLAPRGDVEVLKDIFVTSDWPEEVHSSLIRQLGIRDIVAITSLRRKVNSSSWPEATLRLVPVPGLVWLYGHRWWVES